jgi:hypothetical protein
MKRRMLWGLCALSVALAASSAAGAEATYQLALPAKPAAATAKPSPAAPAPDAAADKPDEVTSSIIREVQQNRRLLTTSVISAPEPAPPDLHLREAVDLLEGFGFRPPARKTAKVAEPTDEPSDKPPPESVLTPEQLAKLKTQIEKTGADEFADPVALADALFRSGHPDHAYTLYERLLADKTTAEPVKAWLLFQMANCKRPSDAVAAATLYGRILNEHAGSAWVGPSKAYKRLLEWRQTVNPEAILESLASPSPEPASKGEAE